MGAVLGSAHSFGEMLAWLSRSDRQAPSALEPQAQTGHEAQIRDRLALLSGKGGGLPNLGVIGYSYIGSDLARDLVAKPKSEFGIGKASADSVLENVLGGEVEFDARL